MCAAIALQLSSKLQFIGSVEPANDAPSRSARTGSAQELK
jgi:hypothetical protein